MNITIFIMMMFTLQAFYWLVGRLSSGQVEGKDDYFLAGRGVSFFPLMMTFLATQVGGGVILGAADEAYRFGWPVLMYPLGGALGLIALGAGLGRKLAEFSISTVAEIFEVVYGSKRLKQTASLLSVVSLFMILVAQVIASNKFLISIGFTNPWLFVLFWAIVILYTAQGGLKAVISTDMVQAAFFVVVFLGCLLFVGSSNPHVLTHPPEALTGVSSKICGWLFMPLLFMVIEQDMGQRCFAAGSPRIVSLATFFAGLLMLVVCIAPVFFGVFARSIELPIPEGASVLMTVIGATMHPVVSALVGCAVLAAIISTATSLINAISSNLFSDFDLTARMTLVRWMTSALSFGAIAFAFYFDNIVDLLIQSYELSVSCLFVPVFFALFRREGRFLSALLSILGGAFGFVFFRFIDAPFPREILSVSLSCTGFLIGEGLRFRSAVEERA